jgi:hypothetical protein
MAKPSASANCGSTTSSDAPSPKAREIQLGIGSHRLAHEFQSFYLAFGELDRADARRVVGKIEAKAPDLGRIDAPENARRVAGDHRDATPFVLAILAADH